jgi:2-dehydropantoate 2-reductase
MATRIAIVGAGGVGGYVGAHLTKGGHDVLLIDAWPEHVLAMRERGITVTAMQPEAEVMTPVRALHVSDVPQLAWERPIDIAFKSYDTRWAASLILPYLSGGGCLVSMQNGINEDDIAAVAGWGRVVGCIVAVLAADLVAPAHIVRNSPLGDGISKGFRIGEAHGRITPRVKEIADLLSVADSVATTSNLWGERWSKLTINAMRNGVCALTGMTSKERDTDPRARDLTIRLGSSCVRVGLAMGLSMESVGGLDIDMLARAETESDAMRVITEQILTVMTARSDEQRPSMAQDIRKGRRTETEWINGLVARRGRELGVEASVHDRVNAVLKRIEAGELAPSPALLNGL